MRNPAIHLQKSKPQSGAEAEAAVRPEDVRHAREALLPADAYADLASLFGALADRTRAAMVHVLAQQELCPSDLALTLGMHRPAISQHLRVLKQLRIVRSRREGRLVLYSLDDAHVAELLSRALEHSRED